jgi:hypothetical protein
VKPDIVKMATQQAINDTLEGHGPPQTSRLLWECVDEIERLRVLERAIYSKGRDTYSWVFIDHRNTPLADAIKEAEQEVQP